MWAGLVRNTEEKMTGKGVDHHFSDSQKGVRGGLGSAGLRNRDGETKEHRGCYGHIILAIACWSSDQMKELCGVHVKRGE